MLDRLPVTLSAPEIYEPEIECLPEEQLATWREQLLARTVQRALGAPFYRERLAALGEIGDSLPIARFQESVPLTTKQDLRQAREHLWVDEQREHLTLVLGTSGTTGTRVALPYTRHDMEQWHRLVARTLWANGLRPEDTVLLPVPVGLFTGGHAMLGGLLQLGCTVLPTGPLPAAVLAEVLQGALGAPPTAVVSLPSQMLRLLDALPPLGCNPAVLHLRLGSFGAEAWTEAARERLEHGYNMVAMDSYGIGELCGPGIAAECAYREGMHVWEDAFFAEIIDPQSGAPVPDGTPGELVLTSLFREAFPLLRYRTGDEACILPGPCACGRTHRRISRVARRLDNVLIITGVNVDPVDLEPILYAFPWIGNEFYIKASGENHDALAIHVERHPQHAAPTDADAQLIAAVRQHFKVRIAVHLHDAGQLERGPGKAQRIRG